MKANKDPGGQMNRDRYAELRRILEERRREIMSEVHTKIRDVRTEAANSPAHGVLDAAETSESDIQDDIEFALIQMNMGREVCRRLRESDEQLFRARMAEADSASDFDTETVFRTT